ncbi:hypothetical protein BH10BAC5_BH10BAC5_26390 [soil metagenome]
MKLLKSGIFLLFAAAFCMSSFSISGCSSAESTTGKLAFNQKDYVKAETELKKGLTIDKTDAEGWYMLGYAQTENGHYADAQASFAQSIKLSNTYGPYIQNYWIEKFNQGAKNFGGGIDAEKKKDASGAKAYYTNALNYFLAASNIIPDSLKTYKAIGETYLALGEKEKAMDVFETVLSRSNNAEDAVKVAAVLFDAGLGMIDIGDYPSAASTFEKIISIQSLPHDNQYYEVSEYNLGLSYAKIGEQKRTANPDSPEYKDSFRKALTYLEPLLMNLKKKDLEPQIYDLMIASYANIGETAKAEEYLKKKDALKK